MKTTSHIDKRWIVVLICLILITALGLGLVFPGDAFALTSNGEQWYLRASQVDDGVYLFVNGTKVVHEDSYLADSGWVNITKHVKSTGRNTTVRLMSWNGRGWYSYKIQLAIKLSGPGESLRVAKTWTASYKADDRPERWTLDYSFKLSSIARDSFGWPTPLAPPGKVYGYEGYMYNWYPEVFPGRWHSGVDANLKNFTTTNRTVRAAAEGKVVAATDNTSGFGITVIVETDHPVLGKLFHQYSHLASEEVYVGQRVSKGKTIGTVGGTGYGKANYWATHLHFEIKRAGAGGSTLGAGYYETNPSNLNPRYFDPYEVIVNY